MSPRRCPERRANLEVVQERGYSQAGYRASWDWSHMYMFVHWPGKSDMTVSSHYISRDLSEISKNKHALRDDPAMSSCIYAPGEH